MRHKIYAYRSTMCPDCWILDTYTKRNWWNFWKFEFQTLKANNDFATRTLNKFPKVLLIINGGI